LAGGAPGAPAPFGLHRPPLLQLSG
jgi:hypothetical protein